MQILIGMLLGIFLYHLASIKTKNMMSLKKNIQLRANAAKVLATNGMTAHLYLAGAGEKNTTLRDALTVYEAGGYVVLNRKGEMVGRLLSKIPAEPNLHLIVDNTKN